MSVTGMVRRAFPFKYVEKRVVGTARKRIEQRYFEDRIFVNTVSTPVSMHRCFELKDGF